jgi:dTDP-glucose pyrophosphorylase
LKAIVLAAGKGTRLAPITDWVPKPLLPIGGRPTIDTLLTSLGAAGIVDALVVVGHLAEKLVEFLGDGAAYGMRLSYRVQSEQRGTAHAVMEAIDFVEGETMVVAGDTAFGPTHIGGLAEFHREAAADLSVSLKRVSVERLSATSSVALAPDGAVAATVGGRITRIVEKPAPGTAPSSVAAAPLHIYPPSLVEYLPRVRLSSRGEYELTDVIALMIADGLRVMGRIEPTAPNLTDQRDILRLNFDYLQALLPENEGVGDRTVPRGAGSLSP